MAERSDEIRREIETTRGRMGDTVDALGHKADVKGRARGWVGDKKDAVVSTVSDATPDREAVKRRGGAVKDTAERNPLGLAIAGAAAGFIAGILAPSTRMEDERLGPISDDVKSTAAEKGQEALEHGREVAGAAAQSAVETAKEEGAEHGRELADSVRGEQSEL